MSSWISYRAYPNVTRSHTQKEKTTSPAEIPSPLLIQTPLQRDTKLVSNSSVCVSDRKEVTGFALLRFDFFQPLCLLCIRWGEERAHRLISEWKFIGVDGPWYIAMTCAAWIWKPDWGSEGMETGQMQTKVQKSWVQVDNTHSDGDSPASAATEKLNTSASLSRRSL